MNLIVTCARHLENDTRDELRRLLEQEGDSAPIIEITDMQGILTVSTKVEPIEFVKKIANIIEDEPWAIRYMLRIIPLEVITETNIEKITSVIPSLISRIKEGETYRISIEKRNSSISGNEIISKVASLIPNKVSLEEPDWEVLIEILGGITGIAVIRKEHIVSIPKLKRKLSE